MTRVRALVLLFVLGCESNLTAADVDAGACGPPPDGFYFAGNTCFPRCEQTGGALITTCGIDAGTPYCANRQTDPSNCGECDNRCTCATGFPQCRLGLCRCSLTP